MVLVDRQDYPTEADEWSDLVADNRLAELSEVDDTLLAEIGITEADLSLTGYSNKQIDNLLGLQQPFCVYRQFVCAGDDAATSIWALRKARQKPMMKPIPLCARTIQNSSRPTRSCWSCSAVPAVR